MKRIILISKVLVSLSFCYIIYVFWFLDAAIDEKYNLATLTFKSGNDYLLVEKAMKDTQCYYTVALWCLLFNIIMSIFLLVKKEKKFALYVLIPSIIFLLIIGLMFFSAYSTWDGYM